MTALETFRFWVLEIQRGNPPMSFKDLMEFNKSCVAAAMSFSDGAKWIPVEERLPEGEGQVLAVNSLGYMACVTSLFPTPGGYDGEDATAEETDYPIGDVTHWMPLPGAPK
jgi:hypothetical protein